MSQITLQVGQCGNQLGHALFTKLQDMDMDPLSHNVFFRKAATSSGDIDLARAVLLDTEPRAVGNMIEKSKKGHTWRYSSKSRCCPGNAGAGNNWAHGYCTYGPASKESMLDAVRREVEQCDWLEGFQVVDEFAGAAVLNAVVCPYTNGEVIVQSYNTIFTLSRLAAAADGVLCIENDTAAKAAAFLAGVERPSLHDLNDIIGVHLAGALCPAYSDAPSRYVGIRKTLQTLCPHPDMTFLMASMVPLMPASSVAYSTDSWNALLKRLAQMHICGAAVDQGLDWTVKAMVGKRGSGAGTKGEFNKAVASKVTLFGRDSQEPSTIASARLRLDVPGMYAGWSYNPLLLSSTPLRLNRYERSATLLSNSQAVLGVLDKAVERAGELYDSRAYVHEYTAHGLEESDFDAAFLRLDQAATSYRGLE